MKKKLLSFIFAICLILPAMFCLSGCKDEESRLATEKDVQVYAEYDENKLEHIVLKASVGETTAYLYGGGQFSIDWESGAAGGSAGGPIKRLLDNENEIISHYANLLYNYQYTFVVPENVSSIGASAFSYTSLTDIEIDCIYELGTNPFAYCKELKSIKITSKYSQYDTRNNCNAIIKDNELVVGCKTTVVPSTVTSIGNDAFLGSSITTFNIPSIISKIGERAFYESSISNISLPNSITSVGKYAFAGCKELTSIQLPNSLSVLNEGLFTDSGITSLNLSDTIETINNNILMGCKEFQTLNIGNYNGELTPTLLFGESATDLHNKNITSLLVDDENTRYSDHNNSNVIVEKDTNKLILGCKNSSLDNSIEIIGDYAFAFSSGLTTITLPYNLTKIGVGAFYDTDLYEVEFNDKLTEIGEDAFMYTKLKNINLIKDDLTIGTRAFSGIWTFEYVVVSSQYDFVNIFFVSAASDLPIVYYHGTPTEFSNKEYGLYFSESWVYFYSENEPSDNFSYYWHYDLDGKTPIVW